jgi:hypothetical protein
MHRASASRRATVRFGACALAACVGLPACTTPLPAQSLDGRYEAYDPLDPKIGRPFLDLRNGEAKLLFSSPATTERALPLSPSEEQEMRRALAELAPTLKADAPISAVRIDKMVLVKLPPGGAFTIRGKPLPEYFLVAGPFLFFHLRKID